MELCFVIIFFSVFLQKKNMKYLKWIIFVVVSTILGVIYYVCPYYSSAHRLEGLMIRAHNDDTIRIGFIGDSWAVGHKSVKCVIESLVGNTTGKSVVVRTAGISGMTSKNIYYGIFRDDSMKDVIEWGPDFCFVVAGINDSDRKMGTGYYQDNMKLIIELMLEHKITPVILEIPSYDICFSYKRRNWQIKLQYLISMILTWSKMDCINEYRTAYKKMIEAQRWEDKVITIWSDDWNHDGYMDKRNIYDEGLMHLNERGYLVLDTCIASKIIEKLKVEEESEYHL